MYIGTPGRRTGNRVDLETHEFGWLLTCRDPDGRLLYYANEGDSEAAARRMAERVARMFSAAVFVHGRPRPSRWRRWLGRAGADPRSRA